MVELHRRVEVGVKAVDPKDPRCGTVRVVFLEEFEDPLADRGLDEGLVLGHVFVLTRLRGFMCPAISGLRGIVPVPTHDRQSVFWVVHSS